MRRVLRILALAALVALAATSSALANEIYTDPTGDSQQGLGIAPDIVMVDVRDDATTGVMTITVSTADSLPTSGEWEFWVNIDLDRNRATGDPNDGTEVWLGAGLDTDGDYWWNANRWDGSDWVDIPVPSMDSRHARTWENWTFKKAELGITTGFDFNVATFLSTSTIGGVTIIHLVPESDYAPDDGMWSYELTGTEPPPPPPAVKPVIGPPVATPAVAGKPMTVAFMVRRSDDGAPVTKATMACNPTYAGRQLAHTESFIAGKAKMRFTVPKAAKGKLVKVKLVVTTEDGQAATRVASFKVR